MKHTQGKWETSINSNGKEWGVCKENGGDMIAFLEPLIEEEANAQLIAMAPRLLEACREGFQALHDCITDAQLKLTPKEREVRIEYAKISRDRLQQAINKAEGKV